MNYNSNNKKNSFVNLFDSNIINFKNTKNNNNAISNNNNNNIIDINNKDKNEEKEIKTSKINAPKKCSLFYQSPSN